MEVKKDLSEILGFYKYKVDHNLCSMEEMNRALKMLQENMEVDGTIADFAKFYGVSESNIRATISRKLLAKPKRKLLYPFHSFAKVAPEKWRK